MSKEEATSLRNQIGDKAIDVRNEVIVQATNAFLLGRQVVLVGLGLTAFGVEQTHALCQQAVARGEKMERAGQQMLDAQWRALGNRVVAKLPSRLAALLNQDPTVSSAARPAEGNAAASSEDKPTADIPDHPV